MRSGYKVLTRPLVSWINAEMERQGVDAQEIAHRAKIHPAVVYKALTGKTAPEPETLERLARALGKTLPELTVVAPRVPSEQAPRISQVEGSVAESQPSADEMVGVEAWKGMSREMQHNLALKIIREALEAQDFAGSPVLRAMHGIAEKMAELGYTQMSRHIWAEMGKYFGKSIPPEKELDSEKD